MMATQLSILFIFVAASISGIIFAETSRKELRTKEINQESIIQLGRPQKSNRIDPSRVIQLSWQPRVFLYKGFLTEEECDRLISGDNEVVSMIDERISAWSFLPKENGTPLQVLHFELEDKNNKYDFFGNISTPQLSGPVLATAILYLSNVTQGGQILFPKSENKIWSDCVKSSQTRLTKGNALLIFNLHLDATPDGASSHTRCPIVEGEMWSATKIFHLNQDSNLVQSDNTDCTDEDEGCPHWAAIGECTRNPVFMVGSPDYYGTCRKSCNVC